MRGRSFSDFTASVARAIPPTCLVVAFRAVDFKVFQPLPLAAAKFGTVLIAGGIEFSHWRRTGGHEGSLRSRAFRERSRAS